MTAEIKSGDSEAQRTDLTRCLSISLVFSGLNFAPATSYKRLIETVRKRQVDVVLVFHYDRLARSTIELITRVEEFRRLGVDFISYHQNVDTTTDIGKLYFTIMAGLAEYEGAQIGRRVKAGMERAKAQGKQVSRPPLTSHKQLRIKELRQQNISIRKIASEVGVSKATVQKYLNTA